MRARILVGMICLGSSAIFPAQADPAAQSQPTQTQSFQAVDAPADDPNQIICRTMGATSGSRIGGARACHTRKEWEMQRQEHQRALINQQNHALMGAPR